MVETLLIVLSALIFILIVVVIIFIFKKTSAPNQNMQSLLNQGRIETIKELGESLEKQKNELNSFKNLISQSITQFEKTNQKELLEFLSKTQNAINELQNSYTLQVKHISIDNKEQVAKLILETTEKLNDLKGQILKEIQETNLHNHTQLTDTNLKNEKHLKEQIDLLKNEVVKSLQTGFEKNEKTLHEFIEKMTLLELSTRQMESLQNEISRFNKILNDHNARGNFGEGVLEQIFKNIFGQDNHHIFYEKQVNLTKKFNAPKILDKNKLIEPTVDFIYYIQTENELLPLAIDAKFPYANYQAMLDETLSDKELSDLEKIFKNNVKERIKETSKYIINNITAPYSIMFIPAEAVFIEIYKKYPDLVEEARSKHVILASPSLIITIIQMMQIILKDYNRHNKSLEILKLIVSIEEEFMRFSLRFNSLKTKIDSLVTTKNELDITTSKIINQFEEVKKYTLTHNNDENIKK